MSTPERILRLSCAVCGAASLRTFALAELRVSAAGEFEPVDCHRCGHRAASPTAPPWRLTLADRKFLHASRIADDDPDTLTPGEIPDDPR